MRSTKQWMTSVTKIGQACNQIGWFFQNSINLYCLLHKSGLIQLDVSIIKLDGLKYYSSTVVEGKTFTLVFCNSVECIDCCKRLGLKFYLLQRWMNSTLAMKHELSFGLLWVISWISCTLYNYFELWTFKLRPFEFHKYLN